MASHPVGKNRDRRVASAQPVASPRSPAACETPPLARAGRRRARARPPPPPGASPAPVAPAQPGARRHAPARPPDAPGLPAHPRSPASGVPGDAPEARRRKTLPSQLRAAPARRRAEQRLDATAELARECERRADAGLIGAGLDCAQGLARETGPPGQFVLGETALGTGAAYHRSALVRHGASGFHFFCYHTCHNASIMA